MCSPSPETTARKMRENRMLAQACWRISAHLPSLNLGFPG